MVNGELGCIFEMSIDCLCRQLRAAENGELEVDLLSSRSNCKRFSFLRQD